MTKIIVTLVGLDEPPVQQAYEAILDEATGTGVEIDHIEYGPTDPHDARNILVGDPVEDATSLWLQAVPDDTIWDFHGEACRRIVEEIDQFPKFHGRTVTLTLRYGSEIKEMLMQIDYPDHVAVTMDTEDAPPAVVHSAPFSYDPFNDYYTEVYDEYVGPE